MPGKGSPTNPSAHALWLGQLQPYFDLPTHISSISSSPSIKTEKEINTGNFQIIKPNQGDLMLLFLEENTTGSPVRALNSIFPRDTKTKRH